jgi:predicted RNA binding protein YcfA (HicA-like mRNA interferase family)
VGSGSKDQRIERNSRKILARLKRDGWQVVSVSGSHHQLKHPQRKGRITLVHPKKDLPLGTARQIHRDAGWL